MEIDHEKWEALEENWIYYLAEGKKEMIDALSGDEFLLDDMFTMGLNIEGIGS